MNKRWDQLEKRVRGEAKEVLRNNVNDGIAFVTVHILLQHDGEPILWLVPSGKRVEPSADASNILTALIGGLS